MPDENKPNGDGENPPEFTPITSQDDLNRVISERINRERAKFADYEDLQRKASKFDELEAANMTEIERANERAAEAERVAAEARARTLRLEVAAEYGISKEDADLFLKGTDETELKAVAERLKERDSERKLNGNVASKEGTNSNERPKTNDVREFTRGLFGRDDS